jgi:hypothetical protein
MAQSGFGFNQKRQPSVCGVELMSELLKGGTQTLGSEGSSS